MRVNEKIRITRLVDVLIFSVLILAAPFVFAQKESGSIEGIVRDNEGRPIPGVAIKVSSPSLIGKSRTVYSDESGFYRFPVLAPGIYEVRAEISGFQSIVRKDLTVSLGATATAHITLPMLQMSETIEIIDEPPLLDVSTTSVANTVPPEIVSNLPKRADIQSLLALTPGVSDDLTAYGANASERGKTHENSFWVDGVNMSDPFLGDLVLEYDRNWIDQVQVVGIGAPAEYGGFTGVLANFNTRSGGNQFHGMFEFLFQNEDLTSSNVPDPAPEQPFKTYDFSTQLGGPIVRDKLWFFSGFEYPQTQNLPLNNKVIFTNTGPKLFNKVTYKWNDENTLQGFLQFNRASEKSEVFEYPETNTLNEHPQLSWNTTWISILSAQTTIEARFGGLNDHLKDIEDQPDLPGHCDITGGFCSVNNFERFDRSLDRVQSSFTLSHYARDFLAGTHDFRFGAEFEHASAVATDAYNGGMLYYDNAGMPYYRYIWEGYSIPTSSNQVVSFAQDEWHITDRFTTSLGVRWENNRASTDRGLIYKNNTLAPRIGFVWKLDQDSKTVLKAHYGKYYEALLQRTIYNINNGLPPFIAEMYQDGEWVEAWRSESAKPLLPDDLKQPFVRQFNIGIDHILPGEIPIGVHYIYRKWEDMILNVATTEFTPVTIINPITGEPLIIYVAKDVNAPTFLTNPDGLFRRYDGLEIFASKHFRNGLSFMGSLVYSSLRGSSQSVNNFVRFGMNPNAFTTFRGKLNIDRPFVWKISGAYALPWGFHAGWFFHHESGIRWTPTIRAPGVPFGITYAEPPGSRQLPSKNLFDLRFEKELPAYRGHLRLTVDVFNLFNDATVTNVNPDFESPDFGQPWGYVEPREIRLGFRYAF